MLTQLGLPPPRFAMRMAALRIARSLDEPTDLIPEVLVRTLSHSLRVVVITTFFLLTDGFSCPIASAVVSLLEPPPRQGRAEVAKRARAREGVGQLATSDNRLMRNRRSGSVPTSSSASRYAVAASSQRPRRRSRSARVAGRR